MSKRLPDLGTLLRQAVALHQGGRIADAEAIYRDILRDMPDQFDALYFSGVAAAQAGRFEQAERTIRRALEVNPQSPLALSDLGNVLSALKRHNEALQCFAKSIALQPEFAGAHLNRGNVYMKLRLFPEALASYERVVAIAPNAAAGHGNRARALSGLGRHSEAVAAFDRVLALNANFDFVVGDRLHSAMHVCLWDGHDAECARVLAGVRARSLAATPFATLSVTTSPADQLKCARDYTEQQFKAEANPLWRGERYRHDRIRVSYLSTDLHDHATATLMAGVFEHHDRSRFETTALSCGPDDDVAIRRRIKQSFEHFIDVQSMSDQEIADLVRKMEIDILVDVNGHTSDARTGVMMRRAAPIQVNYLGYPGTMGAPYIDYIVADRIVIPDDQREFYSERVAVLPGSYQPNDSKRPVADHCPTRVEAGLPQHGFVFCSFCNNYKITPAMFAVWMRLLRQVEGSVLWLLERNRDVARNLRREAEARGVTPERLVFAPHVSMDAHLARQRLADLFLDTAPYNAHTTASEALWVGLPLVTFLGATFPGRVGASLLHAVGLPELVADSIEGYERLALSLARDPARLAALRHRLAQNRDACPLFNTARSTRNLEAAFTLMWQRHQRGEPPASFAVVDD
jgi:predicted O-linked N-acetylglucosamine transferase (SPINDLY family)